MNTKMKLTDFSCASAADYLELKIFVDEASPGVYEFPGCELPNTCEPKEATISIGKSDNGYTLYCYDDIRYCGHNPTMYKLFKYKNIVGRDWAEMVSQCEKFTEESPEPQGSGDSEETDEENGDISDWNNIQTPPSESQPTLNFEIINNELKKVIIGQDEAVETVSFQVDRFLRKKNPKKPLSILAFGTPGVGKSETAKGLADILSRLSGHNYATVWTDLNTFTEGHTVYRLLGSPPGYVGYEDKPVFDAVADNPYTIFIFDELDKAHPQVLKTFMAILDEGRCASRSRLPDGSREYDFKHCIFFFTSNYVLSGEGVDDKKRPIGFSISDTVENIDFKDGAVEIGYKESTIQEKPEDNLTQKIYKNTEKARREFIKYGTLAEIASRFHCFVEYKPLSSEAKARILAKQIIETGFEYGIRIGFISKEVMQGIIDRVTEADSLTVRSFKAVIEGQLVEAFTEIEPNDGDIYRINGTIDEPVLEKIN